ncbi:hypothetical protein NZD89_28030 (plasmid) [Alicyclobacillus fastidiosus]|uniref:Copper amine oxidase-like N-terminal domain-containing protein n=1 Tax=Alicyclobacillus fastidiosus TaxID=392011 RepID=A0ABY6ZPT9_9BACL|nr:hypothetical protein [Alicyclobacillus fastidiosus]WAH44899.1 hypothetical protein NZD89_28030 [Alicyclobacillus fastidiosus]GMA65658.1 hypothetical protein GCM10025859_60980 [Alicyclobacillus fastidiosus]
MKIKAFATLVVLSSGLFAVTFASPAVAHAATSAHSMQKSVIILNGEVFSIQYKFVGASPATTYMPIYYVQQLINKVLGIDSSSDVWNGKEHTWSLTVSSATPSELSSGSGAKISVNGTVIEDAPTIVDVDPASGVQTTFMPIWYVQQLLNQILDLTSGTDVWNGGASTPTWTITTTATGSQETQSSMATAMWNVLDAASWDVNSHPSISDSGITPSSTVPATAGDVATWLEDWAANSKGYDAHPYNNDNDISYRPWSLQYEASQDAFTWANINGLFQGTSLSQSSSLVSSSNATTIISNLKWWVNGYKTLSNGWVELHIPFYSNYENWQNVASGAFTQSQYDQLMTDIDTYYDQLEIKPSGSELSVKLPDASSRNLVWQVVDGTYAWGYSHGTSGTGYHGGNTLSVTNKGPGISIRLASLNYEAQGTVIDYTNSSGELNFGKPYDTANLQFPNG